jgi:hypothetical protein
MSISSGAVCVWAKPRHRPPPACIYRTKSSFVIQRFNSQPGFDPEGTSPSGSAEAAVPYLNSFGVVPTTRDARVLQFALKMMF